MAAAKPVPPIPIPLPASRLALRVFSRSVPVVLPTRGDPRLRLAVVIISLQVLGQVGLGFKLSIAQILVSIGACALVEIAFVYRQERALVWPASALLTGNSVAFILRANGTRAGDWWSLNGIEYFLVAALAGILSKYLIRPGGRHIYNPSNLGLVLCLLLVGPAHVFPQYLWWGPLSPAVVLALAVILAGAVWVLRPLRMLPMVAAFWVTLAVLIAAAAAGGRCFLAVWHAGPICGQAYWLNITTSPELLVFVFFMISDPRTAPISGTARSAYGVAIAGLAAGLILLQPSEYGIKVALLASLTVVCALVPVMDWASGRGTLTGAAATLLAAGHRALDRPRALRSLLTVLAATLLTVWVPIGTAALATNQLALAIDRAPAGHAQPAAPGPAPSPTPSQ